MKKLIIPALFLATAFTACKKDENGNNPLLPDVADAYTGNWQITDTVENSFPGVPVSYNSTTGSVTKNSASNVQFHNFFSNLCEHVNGNVTETSIALLSDSTCSGTDFPESFIATRSGNMIFFSYDVAAGAGTTNHVKGKAVKQ